MRANHSKPAIRRITEKILTDARYLRNIEYGEPRFGHPEGKVKFHIADLEANLDQIASRGISASTYWKLKFLIHVHDTFKAEAERDVPILHPRSHATLAKEYACQYTDDQDLLNILQFHDFNYSMWLDYAQKGSYDKAAFQHLIDMIQDWDLFLMFTIIDGRTKGKELSKLAWFIEEVKKHVPTRVDSSWVDPVEFSDRE
jgi:hypothetical protein